MFSRLHVHLLRRFPSLILAGEAFAPATNGLGNRPSPLAPHPIPTAGCNGTSFTLYSPLSLRLGIHKRALCSPAIATMETGDGAPSSSYLSVLIHCPKDDAVVLSEALLCFGACSASVDDEFSSHDELDEICITSIFMDGQDVHTCISQAVNSVGLKYMPIYDVTKGEQCDWATSIQMLEATNIILNPGLSFGTGEHPTTKLCLLLLKHSIKGGEYFLDYGTGSGVLGITAVKMGVASSVGIDIDPQAVTSALQNMALNEINSNRMSVHLVPNNVNSLPVDETTTEDQASHSLEFGNEKGKFDIIIANILLNPLIELADHIVGFGKTGAVIGLSGILSEQVQQVKERYSEYLYHISVSEMDGWACLHGIKKEITKEK
ncbi:S-adenosyl-L-methionine-dependent methyltransferase protein [Dioscorea alata]|uniref:S-adenosyl-L-methionine-dependent methyltransferase protein n=1 Tax=Dioscorea alata TaxID=55571 RepID=A0ACB7UND7_DIOAL|nr:S-adenosyl-L-methionine-dependent methyltransferase protein [Dioscorea alata]